MTREAKMLAVVEAAREIARQLLLSEMTIEDRCDADVEGGYDAMIESMRPLIRALDAHAEADANAETVTLAVWEFSIGHVGWCIAGSEPDETWSEADNRRLGTFTLPLDREGGR